MRAKVRRSQVTINEQTKQRLAKEQEAFENREPLSDAELAEARTTLIEHMQPRETVMQTMARLSARPAKGATQVCITASAMLPRHGSWFASKHRMCKPCCFRTSATAVGLLCLRPDKHVHLLIRCCRSQHRRACRRPQAEPARSTRLQRSRRGWISSSASQMQPARSSAPRWTSLSNTGRSWSILCACRQCCAILQHSRQVRAATPHTWWARAGENSHAETAMPSFTVYSHWEAAEIVHLGSGGPCVCELEQPISSHAHLIFPSRSRLLSVPGVACRHCGKQLRRRRTGSCMLAVHLRR